MAASEGQGLRGIVAEGGHTRGALTTLTIDTANWHRLFVRARTHSPIKYSTCGPIAKVHAAVKGGDRGENT